MIPGIDHAYIVTDELIISYVVHPKQDQGSRPCVYARLRRDPGAICRHLGKQCHAGDSNCSETCQPWSAMTQ